jgi:hypothetical protein
MFHKVPFAEVDFLFKSASIRVRGHINHGHVMGSDEIFSYNVQNQSFAIIWNLDLSRGGCDNVGCGRQPEW